VQLSVVELVTTSDVAETGQAYAVSALGVVVSDGSPSIGTAEADVVRRVVRHVDDRGVGRLSCKVLECTLVGAGRLGDARLVFDLDLVAAIEGCDPVIGPRGEVSATRDANVGTGMVDGQLASGNTVAIVAADLGPLENVFAIRNPRGDLHVYAVAKVRVALVEAVAVTVTGVALALDDVLIAKEVLLILSGDVVFHSFDESHLNEATIVVVPPPLDRDLLAALEVVLVRDICTLEPAGIVVRRLVRRIRFFARSGHMQVRVGNDRRGGEEGGDKDVLEHREKSTRKKNSMDRLGDVGGLSGVHRAKSSAARNGLEQVYAVCTRRERS
jgi:hypothetical protein